MSSIRGGATGAGKPKPVNVNSVYSGRNLAAGNKPLGKHGMQSVGRNLGVVRRMPPPATLPSLKAENNGQDPTINIVPQAGSGWSKGEQSETARPATVSSVSSAASGPDLRPTWAKAQPAEPAPQQPAASSREFPTLAVSAQGMESKPMNAWTAGAPAFPQRLSTSGSIDDDRQLPSRYYDSGMTKPMSNPNYRPRFQGSSDARASQPNYYSRMEGRERGESMCESIGGRSDTSTRGRQPSESFQENDDADFVPNDPDRDLAVERSRQKRMNFKSVSEEPNKEEEPRPVQQNGHAAPKPQPEYRLLKRPERVEVEEGSEDEEIQLTKLNKPAVRIMKRVVTTGNEKDTESKNSEELVKEPSPSPKLVQNVPQQQEKRPELLRREQRPQVVKEQQQQRETQPTKQFVAERQQPAPAVEKSAEKKEVDEVLPAPPPAENIWAKRKEERESQEKDRSRMPKALQQAIEQHFPTVGDSATIKIDKDIARRPTDSEFARAALRARRAPVSNDVRTTMRRERDDERRQQYSRDDYNMDRGDYNRYQRPPREHSDLGDYRHSNNYGRNQRGGRDRFNASPPMDRRQPSEFEDRRGGEREPPQESYRHERDTFVPRGGRQPMPKVAMGRGRGRGRPAVVHQTRPQYQIQRRPHHERNEEEEPNVENVLPVETPVQEKSAESPAVVAVEVAEEPVKVETESTEQPPQSEQQQHPRHFTAERGGFRGRGRGARMRGEGRRQPYVPYREGGQGDARPRRPRNEGEEDEGRQEQAPRTYNNTRGTRGGYTQQRGRRGQNRTAAPKISRSTPQPRSSEEPLSVDDNRLKSPVVSSEGHEEWETASESSHRIQRYEEKDSSVEQQQQNGSQKISAERLRSKNGRPARPTCRSPSDVSSKQPLEKTTKQPSPDKTSDGLAGLDINNIASVVVIDEHLQETVSPEASAEFEEVMNKKMKKQKALEMQQKQEAEERRRLKEKERQEKFAARKAAKIAAKKEAKKEEQQHKKSMEKLNGEMKKDEEKENGEVSGEKIKETAAPAPIKKEVPVTTVWNSAHVAAMDKQRQEEAARLPSHIPSPIARPTPKAKAAAADSKEDSQPKVELPVSLSSDLKSDKYDFTFDPNIHEAQTREQQDRTSVVSSVVISEAGSITEDFRLKEKLKGVKEFWGEGESSAPLPSNVAKVKPQPQGGEQPTVDSGKETPSSTTGPVLPQRSPSITPFSSTGFGGISFPNYLPDMSTGYAPASHGSVMPPTNPTSPPTSTRLQSMPVGAPYMQQRSGARNTFMDNSMYNPMGAPQRQQSMWAPNAAVDNVMTAFGNTAPPPPVMAQNSAQFNFNQRTNLPHHPPPQMQRGYGPNSMSAGQQKMGNGPMMFNPTVPMDMMSLNMPPPPPHNVGNPHLGSQRNDRPQAFASLMGNSFPPAQPPPHFNQPPPSVDMRFSQPPPPIGHHDMSWSNKHYNAPPQPPPSMGGNFRGQHPMNRGGMPMQGMQGTDVWANTGMQSFSPHHNAPYRMQGGGMPPKAGPRGGPPNVPHHHHQHPHQHQHQDRGDMKRPSSAGQQAANGASA